MPFKNNQKNMEVVSITNSEIKFYIHLLGNIKNIEELKRLNTNDNIILLNPELILNLTHINIALEYGMGIINTHIFHTHGAHGIVLLPNNTIFAQARMVAQPGP